MSNIAQEERGGVTRMGNKEYKEENVPEEEVLRLKRRLIK